MLMSTNPKSAPARSAKDLEHKPWYKHGWVWFLFGIPGFAVISGVIMMAIAINNADSLVADDYYKEGRGINQRLEKEQLAGDLGITLKASITGSSNGMQAITVRFSAKPGAPIPELIRLRLSHPTLHQQDVIATLTRSQPGIYETRLPALIPGHWYAQMEDEGATWRVRATWVID